MDQHERQAISRVDAAPQTVDNLRPSGAKDNDRKRRPLRNGDSASRGRRTRTGILAAAGLVLAAAGLTVNGITTASAADASWVEKAPTAADPSFRVGGSADGTEPGDQARANNLAAVKSLEACRAVGFSSFDAPNADVIRNDNGFTIIYYGTCTAPFEPSTEAAAPVEWCSSTCPASPPTPPPP